MEKKMTCAGCGIEIEGELDHLAHINETGCPGVNIYTITDRCDWCEETKQVRELGPDPENMVLAVCRDCDHPNLFEADAPENITNNKEKNDMNTTDTAPFLNCCAITSRGSRCENNATKVVSALYRTITAYHLDALPAQYQGAGFLMANLAVCGTHKRVLDHGKALSIQTLTEINSVPVTNNASKEDDMQKKVEANLAARRNDKDGNPMDLKGYPISDECPICFNECKTLCGCEGYPLGQGDPDPVEAQEDAAYDKEHSQKEQAKFLEGKPFDITELRDGSKLMIERCDHDDCHIAHVEEVFEADKEICCGSDDCNHFFHLLCLHHDEVKYPGCMRESFVQKSKIQGRVKEWHKTQDHVKAHVKQLRESEFGGIAVFRSGNGHGLWVYWNIDPELNNTADQIENTATPVKRTQTIKANGGVLCGNCRKNGVENPYHESTDAVKSCYMGK